MAMRLAARPARRARLAVKGGASGRLDLSQVTSMQEGMRLLGQHLARRRQAAAAAEAGERKPRRGRARRGPARRRA